MRITGTTSPRGAETAIEISVKSLKTISSPSIKALTAGNSNNAIEHAFVKNDIKPNPTPCVSLNLSLYCFLRSIIGFISTSLKVVNMAVSFFTATNLLAIVFLRDDIFSLLTTLSSLTALTTTALGASALAGAGAGVALRASSLVILPPTPEPPTCSAVNPFSAITLAAAGEG